jgi:hypothetical protein
MSEATGVMTVHEMARLYLDARNMKSKKLSEGQFSIAQYAEEAMRAIANSAEQALGYRPEGSQWDDLASGFYPYPGGVVDTDRPDLLNAVTRTEAAKVELEKKSREEAKIELNTTYGKQVAQELTDTEEEIQTTLDIRARLSAYPTLRDLDAVWVLRKHEKKQLKTPNDYILLDDTYTGVWMALVITKTKVWSKSYISAAKPIKAQVVEEWKTDMKSFTELRDKE